MQTKRIENTNIPLGWLIVGLLMLVAFLPTAHGQNVKRVDTVGFTVSDMDKAIDFYTRILPFEKVSDTEVWGTDLERLSGVFGARARIANFKLGDEKIELTEYLTPQGRPIPIDSRSNDRWFQHIAIIVSDMDKAYAHLRQNKVRHASTGPQTLPGYITAAAGIKAFYFKDFDNHVLEILSFPADKGLPKWHDLSKTGHLFLGIDHTAIVVADTAKAREFYEGVLGLTVAGSSDNHGPEQEHLNNVRGAKLHITGLRTKEPGVAIEFLEYRSPIDGRPYPAGSGSNDLWHWQTSFVTSNIAEMFSSYRPAFVSEGLVAFTDLRLGIKSGAVIRDPDGHAVRLIEQ